MPDNTCKICVNDSCHIFWFPIWATYSIIHRRILRSFWSDPVFNRGCGSDRTFFAAAWGPCVTMAEHYKHWLPCSLSWLGCGSPLTDLSGCTYLVWTENQWERNRFLSSFGIFVEVQVSCVARSIFCQLGQFCLQTLNKEPGPRIGSVHWCGIWTTSGIWHDQSSRWHPETSFCVRDKAFVRSVRDGVACGNLNTDTL